MNIDNLYKLEKEVDKLLQLLDKLKEENKLIKEKCEKLLGDQKVHKELIESLKKENINLSSTSKDNNLEIEKEAKIKEGLRRIIEKLNSFIKFMEKWIQKRKL
jgi:DNA repair exonuclease SbcCD ATPase subunit